MNGKSFGKMKILRVFFFVSGFFTLQLPAFSQSVFRLADYGFDCDAVCLRQYKNLAPDGVSPIVVSETSGYKFKGKKFSRRDENNGDYRLQRLDEKGLKIYQLYFVGDRVIEYQKPVLLVPATIKLGEVHRSETPYKTFVKGELKERGRQIYEVTAEKVEAVQTSTKDYENCLLIRIKALRIDEAGTQKGYELREWHEKGTGAVKITGELFWKNAKGETTRTFKIDAELESFTVMPLPFVVEKRSFWQRIFSPFKRLFK